MNDMILLLPIILPVTAAILVLLVPKKVGLVREIISLLAVSAVLIVSILLFGQNLSFNSEWGGFGIDLSLKLYQFNGFIFLAASGFSFLIVIYSMVFMKGKEYSKYFFMYLLLTAAFVNGAVLANNLIVMLFFWEGLLALLFGMIMTGGKKAFPTAVKAVVLSGVADLCMMLGVGLTIFLSNGVTAIDKINLPMDFMGGFAFVLLMIGAIAKAGAMPFHTWIPDAAVDAPLPFMAFLPAALEKLLGIYFLARICLDMFKFESGSPMSMLMMIIGAVTILFAVMMALIQHDYKRLLSYHAISQVGYMILGIGTAIPVGIVGGLFHMINHAMYKSCLFLTGGSVERQTGTTNLEKLGGLGRKMPITFTCFIIAAASISGVPPFNGFFSKELIFDGALESGTIFYIVAALGAFLTAASFLKLGHAAYFGKEQEATKKVKEAPWPMLVPMIVIAFGCILFGVYNPLPLQNLIEPVLGARLEHTVAGLPHNWLLVAISVVILLLAYLNHRYGYKKTNSGLGAVDHIHYAPGLKTVYKWAELKYFDPYEIGLKIVNVFAKIAWAIDRGIDWIYSTFVVQVVGLLSTGIKKAHTGSQSLYLGWSIAGMFIIILLVVLMV